MGLPGLRRRLTFFLIQSGVTLRVCPWLTVPGWEQDWCSAQLQAFVSISPNVFLLTCVFLSSIPSMPARSTASSAVSWWCGNEASFSFPFQSTLTVEECALALSHGHPGKTHTFDVFVDVLNSMEHVAQVTVKCHACISLLKNWVKNLSSGKTKPNQNTSTPNPQRRTAKEDCVCETGFSKDFPWMNNKDYLPSGTQRFCSEGHCITGDPLHWKSLKLFPEKAKHFSCWLLTQYRKNS